MTATTQERKGLGALAKSYVFWTYRRGSLHYDVMVTAILIFMFVTPHFVDFGDKPKTLTLPPSEVLVKEAGHAGDSSRFEYQIRAEDVGVAVMTNGTEPQRRAAILRVVEPISGEVTLERYEAVKDPGGRVIAYNAWVLR